MRIRPYANNQEEHYVCGSVAVFVCIITGCIVQVLSNFLPPFSHAARQIIHRLSSLENPAVEIPIRPIRRQSRRRNRTDRFQSVVELAQHQ
jgi:hypothetical protein